MPSRSGSRSQGNASPDSELKKRAEFAELFQIHAGEIRRLARLLVRRYSFPGANMDLDEDDLVGETFVRLFEFGMELDRERFLGLINLQMRRILIDHLRAINSEKRSGGREVQASLFNEDDLGISDTLSQSTAEDVREAVSRLPEREQKVLELRFYGGFTEEEAANILGISARTAKRDFRVAMEILRKEFVRR
jgi:RNA polymerase sigma factor (TIGR02999 family)